MEEPTFPQRSSLITRAWETFREKDRAVHARIMQKFPRGLRIIDTVLEALFGIFSHGAFGILCAFLLIVLVATNQIPVIVAVSLVPAWIIAVVWLARLGPIKSLTVISRVAVVLIGGAIFAVAANAFGEWALRESRQSAESGQPQDLAFDYLPLYRTSPVAFLPMPVPVRSSASTVLGPKSVPESVCSDNPTVHSSLSKESLVTEIFTYERDLRDWATALHKQASELERTLGTDPHEPPPTKRGTITSAGQAWNNYHSSLNSGFRHSRRYRCSVILCRIRSYKLPQEDVSTLASYCSDSNEPQDAEWVSDLADEVGKVGQEIDGTEGN
jgi:hypothetical protein